MQIFLCVMGQLRKECLIIDQKNKKLIITRVIKATKLSRQQIEMESKTKRKAEFYENHQVKGLASANE